MIAVDKHQPQGQGVQPAVRERKLCSGELECSEHGGVGDGAEGEYDAEPGHSGDLSAEKAAASRDFARFRLVLGRHATHRIGNPHPAKLQAVIGAGIVYSFGKAKFAQSVIKHIARIVAGERAPCSVRSSQTGR